MIQGLNTVRAVAILLVLISHLPHNKGPINSLIFEHGQLGVILFFGLSGFLVEFTTRKNSYSTKQFAKKRLLRLLPAYYTAILVTYIVASLDNGNLLQLDFKVLLGNIFFLQDLSRLGSTIVEPFMNNSPLWSLSYEFWFYVIYALIQKFVPRTRVTDLSVLLISVTSLLFVSTYPSFWLVRIAYFSFFWFGVLLSKLWVRKNDITKEYFLLTPFVIVFIVLLLRHHSDLLDLSFYRRGDGVIIRHLTYLFVSILMLPILLRVKSIVFDNVASVSYSLYLFHAPLCYKYRLFSAELWINWLLGIIMALLISILLDIHLYNKIKIWSR